MPENTSLASSDPRVLVRIEERQDGARIAYVTINNAGKLNTLNIALMEEFAAGVEHLARDERLRAAVLTGAGEKSFIGGADIDEMAALEASSARAFITRLHRCCNALRELPVPVIARIQGYAFGGGLEIAAACDLRVAADSAQLGMPEVKLGIPSVIEAALLPSLIGWGRAREILLLGETFTASEGAAWGILQRVVPRSGLDETVEAWIAAILRAGPQAVRLQKKLIRAWEDLPLSAAVQAGIDAFVAAYDTGEPQREMAKFQRVRQSRKRI